MRDFRAFDLEAGGQADLVEGGKLEITDIKPCESLPSMESRKTDGISG